MKRILLMVFLISFCFVNFTYAKDFYTVKSKEVRSETVVLAVDYELNGIPVTGEQVPIFGTYTDQYIEDAFKNRAASIKSSLPGGAEAIAKQARIGEAQAAVAKVKLDKKTEIK